MSKLQPKPAKGSLKNRTRKGRGNAAGKGGECGRGHKGQKSRSGYSAKPGFEGGQMPLYKRVPKKRGFTNPFRQVYSPVNFSDLSQFEDGEIVDLDKWIQEGFARDGEPIKLLGNGNCTKKLTLKVHKASQKALDKAKKSGIKVELINE